MTTKEFSSEFDIQYDNASKGAPGLDLYEKSVFLTQAQEEIVKEAYSGYNTTGVAFEGSEKRRRQMSELVRDYRATSQAPSEQEQQEITDSNSGQRGPDTGADFVDMSLSKDSKFYYLPADLMYIILERVTLSDNRELSVTPVTHDEYNQSFKNPFKKPSKNRAWRLDLYAPGPYMKVELISTYDIEEYHIRYVKRPNPIILTNFESEPELSGMDLTVSGENTQKTSELNVEVHRDILSRAVEIAILAARENVLQNKVKMNRNPI